MEPKFEAILKNLPPQVPRSRLQPYSDLIREMRKRGRPYREITEVLHAHFGVSAGISTVRDFVRQHLKSKAKQNASKTTTVRADRNSKKGRETNKEREAPVGTAGNRKELERNIRESTEPNLSKPATPVLFRYNHDEPLRILRKKGEHDE